MKNNQFSTFDSSNDVVRVSKFTSKYVFGNYLIFFNKTLCF